MGPVHDATRIPEEGTLLALTLAVSTRWSVVPPRLSPSRWRSLYRFWPPWHGGVVIPRLSRPRHAPAPGRGLDEPDVAFASRSKPRAIGSRRGRRRAIAPTPSSGSGCDSTENDQSEVAIGPRAAASTSRSARSSTPLLSTRTVNPRQHPAVAASGQPAQLTPICNHAAEQQHVEEATSGLQLARLNEARSPAPGNEDAVLLHLAPTAAHARPRRSARIRPEHRPATASTTQVPACQAEEADAGCWGRPARSRSARCQGDELPHPGRRRHSSTSCAAPPRIGSGAPPTTPALGGIGSPRAGQSHIRLRFRQSGGPQRLCAPL